jgi:four helix bundle protein
LNEKQFRFEDLEIWQRAAAVTGKLFSLSEQLDASRKYRFAEQLRAATLSITNNIAEGSGSASNADFANFLNTARRSLFEVANMLMIFTRERLLAETDCTPLINELEQQSRMILAFMRTLRK